FLPWMADTAAWPLVGHGLTSRGFVFDTAPGPGTSLELALFGLVAVAAVVAAFLSVPVTSVVLAVVAVPLGVHLSVRDHPGLSSGPGAVVATAAMVVLAAAQVTAAVDRSRGRVRWWSVLAGGVATAVVATGAGLGGAALASA